MNSSNLQTRLSLALTLLLLIAAAVSGSALAQPAIGDTTELQAFMDEVIRAQMRAHHVPAVTLSIVRGGDIILARGYGYADLDQRIPVDPERSLFRPGSVSKLFTWTAVMQLVEQGHLDLDTDISEYLDFNIPNRLITGNSDPDPITMRHLLTHTPGFEDVGGDLFALCDQLMPLAEYLRSNMPVRVFPPGTVLAYSNYGTALAGYIVEQISGLSFHDYIDQNVLAPLNMTGSTFRQPLPDDLAPHMVKAARYIDGQYYEVSFEFIPPVPAGSLSCTSVDMARFMIAHLQDGRFGNERVLERDTVQEMHRQQFTHHPAVVGVAFGFFEDFANGTRVLFHGGNTMLFHSQLFLLPEHDLGLFVCYAGGDSAVGRLPSELFWTFMNHYFPHPGEPLPRPPADARERARDYLGEYHPARISHTGMDKLIGLQQVLRVDMNEDGYLMGSFMGQSVEFVEVEPGVYRSRANNVQLLGTIAFTDGPGGETLLAAGMFTWIKAPWYGTLPFLGALTLFALVLMLLTLVGWSLPFIFRSPFDLRTVTSGRGERTARVVGVAVCLTTIVFLGSIVKIVNQGYGMPDILLGGMTPWARVVFTLPWLLIPLGLAMILFAVAAWRYGYWTWPARVHYSLLAASLLGLLWVLRFTNAFM